MTLTDYQVLIFEKKWRYHKKNGAHFIIKRTLLEFLKTSKDRFNNFAYI